MFDHAYILAGGSGSRLRGITNEPKPLIKINGKPHIINLLNQIFLFNFKNVTIIVRYGESETYRKSLNFLCKEVKENLSIKIVEEIKPLGTSGWIIKNLENIENYFVVFNADTFFSENIFSTLNKVFIKKQNAILAKRKGNRIDSGAFKVNKNSLIEKFVEKNNFISDLESIGIYALKNESIKNIKHLITSESNSFEFDVFPNLIKNRNLYGYEALKFNHDYGTKERLIESKNLISQYQIKWLFLDRDNTLNYDLNSYTHKISDLKRITLIDPILKSYQEEGYHLCVISNQSGIGRKYFTLDDMKKFNNKLSEELQKVGININLFLYCPHLPDENCSCRKPNIGLLKYIDQYFGIDRKLSILIGNSECDINCAKKFNINSLKLNLIP